MSTDEDDEQDPARALAELRARYETMVERAPEAIVVFDRDTQRFVEVNAAACRLFAMERGGLLRTGPVDLSPERQPDGRRSTVAVAEHVEQALAGETPVFEWTHRNAQGRNIPCRVQLARVAIEGRNLVRGNVQDLSELVASARALERLHRVLEATTDLVSIGDTQGRVLWINPAGRRLLGLDADEDLAGADYRSFHTEASARRLSEEGVPHAMRHGSWQGETEFQACDGRRIPVSQVVIAHEEDEGTIQFVSTIARDLSDRKALERRTLREQKLESLGLMAGGIAHDFNNLLLGILGNAELLGEDLEPESEVHGTLREIVAASERAAELARQMLFYAGSGEVVRASMDLSALAHEAADRVAAALPATVELRREIAEGLPSLRGDPDPLRQALENLLLNAVEAYREAGGTITLRTAWESVDRAELLHDYLGAAADGARPSVLVCEVRDHGSGMSPAVVERIFDPFFSTRFVGRGLGLAMVLGIVRSHHGGIAVTSDPGAGTTIRVVLPAGE